MGLLAIQEANAGLSLRNGTLTVTQAGKPVRHLPLHAVDEVHLFGPVQLSAAARNALLARKVRVLLLDGKGRYLGVMEPPGSRAAERRARQYERLQDADTRLQLASACVRGKLFNQRVFLRHGPTGDKRPDAVVDALVTLRRAIDRLAQAKDVDVARGIEGYATRMYFAGLGATLTNPEISFTERNRRPPRDPFNACLSFGYTMLLARVQTAVWKIGLDPSLGALHEAGRGKPALALDLMEELRPVVVDRLVARLVNRRQLTVDDFENPTGVEAPSNDADARPPVYLGPTGRGIFLRELGNLWRRKLHYEPEDRKLSLAGIVDAQARRMARALEDDELDYEPFLIR